MSEFDESESKPRILVIGGSRFVVARLNSREGLSFVFSDEKSNFKNCEGILFYPVNTLSPKEELFEQTIVSFGEDVESLGGIEGVVMYVWVEECDRHLKEELVKMLRLEERGCVWGFGAGSDSEVTRKMDHFFKENIQTIVLKPAKRD